MMGPKTIRDKFGRYAKGNQPWSIRFKGRSFDDIYGKEKSNKIKEKLSLKIKGRILSDEHKNNISLAHIGRSWNDKYGDIKTEELRRLSKQRLSGKTLIDLYGESQAKDIIEKRREKMIGHMTSQETRDKIGASNKIYILKNGHALTGKTYIDIYGEERAKEIIAKKSGINSPKYGKTIPEWHKQIIRESRAKQICPLKDTKIELKIQDYLKRLGVEFYTHQYRTEIEHGYQCDIFVPVQKGITQKTIIECDGDYWHGNILKFPNLQQWQIDQVEKDRIRTEELKEQGFRVIRLWENEINSMSINDLKSRIINQISMKGGVI